MVSLLIARFSGFSVLFGVFCYKAYILYHKISGLFVVMSEVHRINSKGLMKLGFILHPVKTNETILITTEHQEQVASLSLGQHRETDIQTSTLTFTPTAKFRVAN